MPSQNQRPAKAIISSYFQHQSDVCVEASKEGDEDCGQNAVVIETNGVEKHLEENEKDNIVMTGLVTEISLEHGTVLASLEYDGIMISRV